MPFASNEDFAILASLLDGLKAIEPQSALLLLFAMTAEARCFQDRLDVFGVGKAFLFCGGREFRGVDFADIPFLFIGRLGRNADSHEAGDNPVVGVFHICLRKLLRSSTKTE